MTARRRRRGEGLVRKRPDGRWEVRLDLGKGADGKRRRKVAYARTWDEAHRKLDELKALRRKGALIETRDTSVATYLDLWLSQASANLAANTVSSYEAAIRLHLKPYLGGLRLSAFRSAHIRDLHLAWTEAGVGERAAQNAHVVLRAALQQAVRDELIVRNPAATVQRPAVRPSGRPALDARQIWTLLDSASDHGWFELYLLAITSGARQGELFALRWGDVSLDLGFVRIERQVLDTGGKLSFGPPKNNSRRVAALPPLTVEALRELKSKLDPKSAEDLVFPDSRGGPLRRQNFLRRVHKPILLQAELVGLRFHDLRHAAATLLADSEASPKAAQAQLGHKNIQTTLDTYTKARLSQQAVAVQKLERHLLDHRTDHHQTAQRATPIHTGAPRTRPKSSG